MMEARESKKVLDPVERASEIIFGLIMVLSFTGSISVATDGREEIRTMVVGAIGCNLAWGIVDAVMYLLTALIARNRDLALLRALHAPGDPGSRRGILSEELPSGLVSQLRPEELDRLVERAREIPTPSARAGLTRDDVRGAVGVFLLVFVSTFPVVVPFLLIHARVGLALRISNGVALAMLYLSGYRLGRHAGLHPVRTGLVMAGVGIVLVLITIALGG